MNVDILGNDIIILLTNVSGSLQVYGMNWEFSSVGMKLSNV